MATITATDIEFDITVDAYNLARVWLSTAIAQGDDANQPELDSTTLLELHTTGIRLVSTDGFILIAGWVPENGTDNLEPPLTRRPLTTLVTRDSDGRAGALLAYLKKATNGNPEGKTEPIPVHLYTTVPKGAQAVLAGMESVKLVIEIPDERLVVDTTETPFPNWRPFFQDHHAAEVVQSGWSPLAVLRLGQLAKLWGNRTLRLTFGGPNKAILVDMGAPVADGGYDGLVPIRAIAMPVRDHSTDDPVEPEPDPARPTLDEALADVLGTGGTITITADDTVVRPIRPRKGKAAKQ